MLSAVGIATLLLASASPNQVIPGTYNVSVCSTPCALSERADVHGQLIILAGDLDVSRLPHAEREYLEDQTDFILHPDIKPNACFVLETSNEDTRLLAGLRRIGLTRWHQSAGVLTVTLYRSPDASDTSAGVIEGSSLRAGPSEEARIRGSSPYRRSFLAGERVGKPDVSLCVSAAADQLHGEQPK